MLNFAHFTLAVMKRFGVAVLLAFVVPALWAQDDSLSFEKFPEQDADDSDGALIDDDLIQPRNKRGDGDYYSDAWGGSEDDHPDERSPNIDTEPEMGSGEEDDLQPDTEGEGSVGNFLLRSTIEVCQKLTLVPSSFLLW